ncbi:MAG: hypothetical protein UX38_C0001G0051 [Microgenomates group bacterium GW2011_GWC1_46_16]|uniref:ChsH2 C-terminal OB-fold domain-containing protein n=1 Tax=Candidatus Collierbacteria bacterium RIFOXYA2_FULL_46_10 TaxID=1817726 RepID=A0A1F5F455_9BACT|nr:MAG: hypothetical protein UX32_C0004G0006 [Microgenomates group bacterium GW2011_GWF1_46_12]KKU27051.1 MAG: hypothetical protein UX38_C0001G0051 [Microgenomates group bacterium GW2011_GWC1_46_16]KKU44309.1 MAG: hypothetical protein UX59_C0001G0028 [Microgenomates group bacterium GW2011_GWA1_46_7]KKU60928.1 MAG: hypothetical protein UX82_C0006G0014 [Microgenomates group bacterium GW2011_GWE1_47_12]KKU62797.1 MAG: hypothetical protein UX84_C0002G0058 [Microgenomates group bacterium GW2011_GWD1
MNLVRFSGRGEVYSVTQVGREQAPSGFVDLAPYGLAIVELPEGLRILGRLTDLEIDQQTGELELPQIGDQVEMVIRKGGGRDERGIINYQYTFRPPIVPATEQQVAEIRGEIAKWIKWGRE